MKWMFWTFLSVAFPWLVLLLHDNPGGAVVALVMQATAIGWIPATLWAMRTVKEAEAKQKNLPKK
jgi:hypothetical protein